MTRNKGFTLVELLAVIVITAIIITVAVPSVLTFSENQKKNLYCSKVDTIEKAAQLYGDDNYESIFNEKIASNCEIDGENIHRCQKIKVSALLAKNYLKKEENATTGEKDEIYDPRDNTSMKDNEIYVTIKNKRAYATFVYETEADAKLCDGKFYISEGSPTVAPEDKDPDIYNEDTSIPTCTFTYNVALNNGWFNQYPTPTITTSEAGSSGLQFGYGFSSTPNYDLGYVQATKVGKKTVAAIREDTSGKNIYCFVSTNEGTENSTSEVIKIDTTKPTLNVVDTSSTTYTQSKIVNISIQDKLSGLPSSNTIKYAWSTSNTTAPTTWTSKTINATSGTTEVVTSTISSPDSLSGIYYLWIKGGELTDVAGNKDNSSNIVTGPYYFDNEAPTCGTATGASTDWTTGNRTIQLACNDLKSGCEKNVYETVYTTSTKTATITIKDKAGNTKNCTYNVYVDKTGEVCEFDEASKSELIGHSISFTGDCTKTVTPTSTTAATTTCTWTNSIGRTTTCTGTYTGKEGNVKNNSGIHYNNLADAFSATATNGTITVLKSYTDSSAPTLTGKTMNLNLNGKTLTKSTTKITIGATSTLIVKGSGTATSATNSITLFHVYGKMTAQDGANLTSSNSNPVIKTDKASSATSAGYLNISNANIINSWETNGTANGAGSAVVATNGSTVDISSSSSYLKSYYNRVIEAWSKSTINFKAGKIINGKDGSDNTLGSARGFANIRASTLNMTGGYMYNYAPDSGAGIMINGTDDSNKTTVNISGGELYVAYLPGSNCTLCLQGYSTLNLSETSSNVKIYTSSKTSLQATIWAKHATDKVNINGNIEVICKVGSPSFCIESNSDGRVELFSDITVTNNHTSSRKCSSKVVKNGHSGC